MQNTKNCSGDIRVNLGHQITKFTKKERDFFLTAQKELKNILNC